jgi:hypothetical protein
VLSSSRLLERAAVGGLGDRGLGDRGRFEAVRDGSRGGAAASGARSRRRGRGRIASDASGLDEIWALHEWLEGLGNGLGEHAPTLREEGYESEAALALLCVEDLEAILPGAGRERDRSLILMGCEALARQKRENDPDVRTLLQPFDLDDLDDLGGTTPAKPPALVGAWSGGTTSSAQGRRLFARSFDGEAGGQRLFF